jgi:hypothetical protein
MTQEAQPAGGYRDAAVRPRASANEVGWKGHVLPIGMTGRWERFWVNYQYLPSHVGDPHDRFPDDRPNPG